MRIVKIILLFIIVSLAMYTDIKENKIKNKHLIIPLVLGIVLSFISGGVEGMKDSLLGMIIPIGIFFVVFLFRMFGAGDIKLYCTIGAIMGVKFIENNIIYSFLLAGIIVIVYLLITRKLTKKIIDIYFLLKNSIVTKSIGEFSQHKYEHFPFASAIFAGTLFQVILGYNFI
ncbi:A24 family peptidase [Inconstantimicrobium mannanitabidum]|uniref:Type 4 prepilin peptidase 1 n=1 Tax=Inconstantimicrobium mannanitabidum TaxID=1604901 RepID=A0ACB5REA0_9CLOT|nr:prepilin peptidase [Clostridium sp. TW13]GKX67421.1 type 4 prepilin peptidase 1 [Clostridium sp. TW13]